MSGLLDQAGLTAGSGLSNGAGLYKWGNFNPFDPTDLDPYLLFDTGAGSMIGTLENPTLDLDPSNQETLDVITATRAGTATFTDANGLIASAPANTVRVDYVDGVPMILVEPSATNLVTNSTSFQTTGNVTQESGIDAPDGTNTATRISNIAGAPGTDAAYSIANSITPSSQVNGSIYLRGEAGKVVRLYMKRYSGGGYIATNATSVVMTGDWQRYSTYLTLGSGNTSAAVTIRNDASVTADSVDLWGGQIESGSVATSIIPTSGSTVTRAADDLVISGSDFDFYNQSEGTIYTEFIPRRVDNYRHLFEFSNGTTSNRMNVNLLNSNAIFYIRTGGTDTVNNVIASNVTTEESHRIACSYKNNDARASFDGGSEIIDTVVTLPPQHTKMFIGDYTPRDGDYILTGHIKRLIYWPTHSSRL